MKRLVGLGGTAAVYEATATNGEAVAVKVLHPELAADSQARHRFLRESAVGNDVGHPDVVRVLDAGEDSAAGVYLVMELLAGRTLEDEWRDAGGILDEARVVVVATSVLDVLDAAHQRGIIHRDVKPANVFVTNAGSIKMLDFGVARLLSHPRSTPTGDALGTAEFIAPEQARGLSRDVDARTDLYSLGATMFTLLTGRYVHPTSNPLERLILAATRPVASVMSVRPDLAEDIGHVIDLALAFDRSERWPSARDMRDALQRGRGDAHA